MKLLLCNVAWMRKYQGVTDDDIPRHGGQWVTEHGYGHEAINFLPHRGHVYGFIQTYTINVERINPAAGAKAEDVLVVWRARSKIGSVVIGWFKHATVYRHRQEAPRGHEINYEGERVRPSWLIRAKNTDAFLVPEHKRLFTIPVMHKGFGSQTFVSFLDSGLKEVEKFKCTLLEYIQNAESGRFTSQSRGTKSIPDPEHNARIEKAAVDAVAEYYAERGYDVTSVETEKCGYDLIAQSKTARLLVEIKGTSQPGGRGITVSLTPNEYRVSTAKRTAYRICISTGCLTKPRVHEFVFNTLTKQWEDEQSGTILNFKEVVSADVTIT